MSVRVRRAMSLAWIAVLPIAGLLASGAASAAAPETIAADATAEDGSSFALGKLMQRLAARGDADAEFDEELHLPALERPLASSGTLHFRAGGVLEKKTARPRVETLRYADGVATAERGGRRLRLDLRRHPEALLLVEGLRATLAGDAAAIERLFEHQLTGDDARWALRLRPREPGARSTLSELRIEGSGADLTGIELLRADGGRTKTRIRARTGGP